MPPKLPAKTSRRARLLVSTAILAGVVVLTAILSFSIWRWRLRESINGKIAAIRAEGLPVDWQDLMTWPAVVPDDENAAFIYTNAIAQRGTKSERNMPDVEDVLQFRQPISAALRMQFEMAVETNSVALTIINQVTNALESRYPVNFLDGPNAALPHLEGLKDLAKILACDAILKADGSNAPASSDDVQSILKLSQSLDNDPSVISQLTSGAILTIGCQTIQAVLCRMPLQDAQLSGLAPRVSAIESTNRMLIGLIGDRALYNEFLRLMQDDPKKMVDQADESSSGDDQSELPSNPGVGWKLIGFFERDRNFFLDGMATNIFLIRQGPPGSLALAAVDDQLSRDARKSLDIFSAMLLPVTAGIARRDASIRAELRDTVAAIAIERWRSAHGGALPESLNDLVPAFLPAIPADPFDGKPLRYRKLKTGYCVYSVGPNQRDDGGREIPPPSRRKHDRDWMNYDIVFTVER